MLIVISIIVSFTHHHRIHHPILVHHLPIHSWHHHQSWLLILLRTVSKGIIILHRVEVWSHILASVPFSSSHHHVLIHHLLTHLWWHIFIETVEVCILILLLSLLFFLMEERIVPSRPSTSSTTIRAPYHSRRIKSIEVTSTTTVV